VEQIVGRETELEAVGRFLDAVRERAAALVIDGEAGIGKTTVWQEAVAAAEARGFRVLQARPAEAEASLSYAALADLVGAAFDETCAELPDPQKHALDAALLRADPDASADPRTTATAFVAVLTALAARRPTVVAIDDVQWLDQASARALEFAARRLPPNVGLLLTRRSDSEGEAPLALDRTLRDLQFKTLVPRPLSLAGIHHVIANRFGTAPARPTLARIAAASGGNPFFALEIASALVRDPGERPIGAPLPVPTRLHELVAARVRTLSPSGQEAVLVASMLSRPAVGTLTAALGTESGSPAGLIEAEEAGVLVTKSERIRFSHPLLATAVYGSVSPQRRRELHRRLAAVVRDPEERARHLAQSATEPNEEDAAELERAAEQAGRRGAQDAAAELFEAACRLTPADRTSELVRRLLAEGSAIFAAGDIARARSLAERAVRSARGGSSRAEAHILAGRIAVVAASNESAVAHLEKALADASDDRVLRARIHAGLAIHRVRWDDVRAEHAATAIELLDEDREPVLLADVLFDKLLTDIHLGRGASPQLLEKGLALEAKAGPYAEKSKFPLAHFRVMDMFDAARARARSEDRWYSELGDEGWRAKALADLAEVELRAGNWPLAERYVEESCEAIAQLATGGRPGIWAVPLRIRSSIDAHRGNFERARATMRPLLEEAERTRQLWWAAGCLSVLGFVEFASGADAAASSAWTRMAEHTDSLGVKDHARDRSEPDHIEALLVLGEKERARTLLEHLEWRGRTLPRPWIDATLPRARALVRAAEGDVSGALEELEGSTPVEQLPFERARTLLVQGTLCRRLKRKRVAADALRGALEVFEQVGSPPWAERARAELARLGLRRSDRWQLTETERRVAELAAAGRTNREVAQQLFISPKTVEANLARVYRKLSISSRAELGARIAERARGRAVT
jgi:DNA-binding CsgD family transcriptional regulator